MVLRGSEMKGVKRKRQQKQKVFYKVLRKALNA